MSKISGSHTNLTYLKNKFGSCLGLKDQQTDAEKSTPKINFGKKIKIHKILSLTSISTNRTPNKKINNQAFPNLY